MPQPNLISETIGTVLSVFVIVSGATFTCITGLREHYKFRLERCKEEGAGKTAVDAIRKDVEELKKHNADRLEKDAVMRSLIHRLERDCEYLMQNFLQGYGRTGRRATEYRADDEEQET